LPFAHASLLIFFQILPACFFAICLYAIGATLASLRTSPRLSKYYDAPSQNDASPSPMPKLPATTARRERYSVIDFDFDDMMLLIFRFRCFALRRYRIYI